MRKNIVCSVLVLVGLSIGSVAQEPMILSVSDVVVGASQIRTLHLYAAGKWSDAGENAGSLSTQVHCYKALGFCEVAFIGFDEGLRPNNPQMNVNLATLNILRWDGKELLADDSEPDSPICVVNTLRADFTKRRVTWTAAYNGKTEDPFCKHHKLPTTAILLGRGGIIRPEGTKK